MPILKEALEQAREKLKMKMPVIVFVKDIKECRTIFELAADTTWLKSRLELRKIFDAEDQENLLQNFEFLNTIEQVPKEAEQLIFTTKSASYGLNFH